MNCLSLLDIYCISIVAILAFSFLFLFFQKPVPQLLTVLQIIVVFTFFYVGNIPRKKVAQRLFGRNSLCVRR